VSTILLFIRHAEVHNPRDVVYARLPRFGLSARGREQARRVAACLADVPLAAIYTSPLLRARQTTAAIAAHHAVPVRRSALLLEIGTSWAGTPNKEVPKGTSFYVARRVESDETAEQVLARMQKLLRLLARRHAGQIVACVGHADPIATLTLWAGGHEVTPKLLQQPLAPARGAVTVFEYPTPCRATPEYLARPILSYWNPQDPEKEPPKEKDAEAASAESEAASAEAETAAGAQGAAADGSAAPDGAALTDVDGARRNGAAPAAEAAAPAQPAG
jgi:broad specificity phosphatase PhoE